MTTSNGVLTSRRSVIQLGSGAGTLAGPPPDGTPVTRLLREVVPENVVTKTGGDTITLWADCGRAARDVLGVGGGTGKNHGKVTATYAASGRTVETSAFSPSEMADEIVTATLAAGSSPVLGWARHDALSRVDRDAFDKATGINLVRRSQRRAGDTRSPAGARRTRARRRGTSTGQESSCGAVAMLSRWENYAVGRADAINTDWNFQMYGSATKAVPDVPRSAPGIEDSTAMRRRRFPCMSDEIADCSSAADVERLDGRRVALTGVYEEVDVRARPAPPAVHRGHAAVRLDDGLVVLIEPIWSEQAIRGDDEIARARGRPVAVRGVIRARCPEPPEPSASIVSACIVDVERVDLT